ncbi:hypothetical protein Pint_17594 [Pistacia integerrima]|uniref:Uncharacterized protein n=1 Tax=Pistacia integerrima TaxID=434235 RepID=A0ACC0YWQ5_9ROSI|nr:hypothetical protein Pint_17594 [Pistacia integerrima]
MEGLSLICAGLGMVEEDERGNRISYYKGEFLKRDDPQTREVFKQVCKWNIVSKDLIPIIEHCQDDRNLVLNAVKVLVFLTMPFEPSSKIFLDRYIINVYSEAFTEDDWKLVQLVLTLFRNVLAVQDIPLQQKAGGSASQFISLRDGFLELLLNENVMDIILVITLHVGGSSGYFDGISCFYCTGDSSDGEEPVATNEVDFKLWLLTIFYDILAEQRACPDKDYANIVDFWTRLIRGMKNQPLLFVEIIFWKTCKECHYINAEYLLHELGNIKKKTEKWQNSLEVGDIGSSQANGWVRRSIADALGDDEANVVIPHELGTIHNNNTIFLCGNGEMFLEMEEGMAYSIVREVDEKEKSENGEIFMQQQSGKVSKRKRRLFLSDEWDVKISELYEKQFSKFVICLHCICFDNYGCCRFKDDQNCSHLIAESLDADGKVSAAQVSNKLKQLGFKVPSKKMMRHTGDIFTAGPDEPGEEQNTFEIENNVHNSNDPEGNLLRQPL